MAVPTFQGSVAVMRSMQACLEAELDAVLSDAATGLSVTLAPPESYWRGEIVPGDATTPGVGLYVTASSYDEVGGSNVYTVNHEVAIRLVISDANGVAWTVSDFADALHAYAQAVCYTLSRYYVAGYGASVGAYTLAVIDSTPLPYAGDADHGEWMQEVEVRVLVTQRVARWEA